MWPLIHALSAGIITLAAFSSSNTLQLNSYSLGGSNTNNSHSATYYIEGSAGELQGNNTASPTYTAKSGGIAAQQTSVPPAPNVSNNAGAYYNKLQLIISTGNNPADTNYSVAISTSSNFTTTNYVQSDGSIGASPVYRTYSAWGSTSGTPIIGLTPATAYYVKVNAMQGMYTASGYGPVASATTGTPNLSFSLSTNTASLATLSSGSIATSSLNLTYATNAYNGGYVYVMGQNGGLHSTAANYTIASATADLTAGQGFGIRSSSAAQSSGGPFSAQSPYTSTGNIYGAVSTSLQPLYATTTTVGGATGGLTIGASRGSTTPAASDYQEILTFIAAASF